MEIFSLPSLMDVRVHSVPLPALPSVGGLASLALFPLQDNGVEAACRRSTACQEGNHFLPRQQPH